MVATHVRWLIDGYNVMHAAGRIDPRLGREGFRRARRRFLDELADAFRLDRAEQITLVFDATTAPGDFQLEDSYRGMRILFALNDENADARIEQLIAEDPSPKSLTVVSSDHRIRRAARRRKAKDVTADTFWELIDRLKERAARTSDAQEDLEPSSAKNECTPGADESAFWIETFRDAVEAPAARAALAADDSLLTESDIAEIQREIERES